MGRLTIFVLAIVALGCGCAEDRCRSAARCSDECSRPCMLAEAQPTGPSSLIFDRHPGMYSADQFTYRSDWPSTLGYFRAPEVVFYREYFRDRQGPGVPFNDNTYRRFDTLRFGQAVR